MDDRELDEILKEIRENKGDSYEPSKRDRDENIFAFVDEIINKDEKPLDEPVHFVREEVELVKEEEPDELNIMDEIFKPAEEIVESLNSDAEDEYEEEETQGEKKKLSKKAKIIISAVVCAIVIAAVVLAVVLVKNKTPEPTTKPVATEAVVEKTTQPIGPVNPLTGEEGYSESALTQRPVAIVVENEYSTASVKPQWGLDDADIVLEGESEYSTRLLLFWADYNNVPKQVGPARSARPPFIRFSELFDAVFIHAGLSNTANGYVGADTVFEQDNVDHINLLHASDSYFGRDYSRTSVVEHTGYFKGDNCANMLESYKINTSFTPSDFTQLKFNREQKPLSSTTANTVSFRWNTPEQGGRCPKTAKFTYDPEKKTYWSNDFDSQYGESSARWANLIFLLDTTQYIEKENYKGSGQSEIYCDYSLSGGKGTVVSNGTAIDITWGVDGGKLWMKDSSGKDVLLNPGKSYIGYGSQNKGGVVTLNPEA